MLNMKAVVGGLLCIGLVITSCNWQKKENRQQESTVIEDKPIDLTKETFVAKIAKLAKYDDEMNGWKYLGDKPAIVDFGADWCGPCRKLAPILDELAMEYAGKIYIYKIDVDREPELAQAFAVRNVPTLLFVPMKGKPEKIIGGQEKEEVNRLISSVLLKK